MFMQIISIGVGILAVIGVVLIVVMFIDWIRVLLNGGFRR